MKCSKMHEIWQQNTKKFASGWDSAPDPAGGLPSPRPPGMDPPSQIPGYATDS